jgi:hypothetical protein
MEVLWYYRICPWIGCGGYELSLLVVGCWLLSLMMMNRGTTLMMIKDGNLSPVIGVPKKPFFLVSRVGFDGRR